ncbi:MAG TPA: YceI family protein [Candidatus Eremiobacteraceae bacterium]|nr:YceI family protein [Candidatus Eremiobacteraceae bacterium]
MKLTIQILPAVIIFAAAAMAADQTPNSHVHAIDVARSHMTVSVYKEGIFAFAADNHVVNASIASGWFNDESKAVDVRVDATKMQVLDPKMPSNRRDQVQANMIGPEVLDAAHYTLIEFRSSKIATTDGDNWSVAGDLTLHGQTHPLTFSVTRIDAAHFKGTATVRQSTFGISPIRIAGGTVRVKDDVKVEFEISL